MEEGEREEKRVRCGFRLRGQVDPPGMGTYIHKGAPNYRFAAFFRPLFARSPVSHVLFPHFSFFPLPPPLFLFILPAVRRNLPRPERARLLPREFLRERACRIFLMAAACVPSAKNRTRRRTIAQIGRVRRFDCSKSTSFSRDQILETIHKFTY